MNETPFSVLTIFISITVSSKYLYNKILTNIKFLQQFLTRIKEKK